MNGSSRKKFSFFSGVFGNQLGLDEFGKQDHHQLRHCQIVFTPCLLPFLSKLCPHRLSSSAFEVFINLGRIVEMKEKLIYCLKEKSV
jgi:hypothetical protein